MYQNHEACPISDPVHVTVPIVGHNRPPSLPEPHTVLGAVRAVSISSRLPFCFSACVPSHKAATASWTIYLPPIDAQCHQRILAISEGRFLC